MLSRIAIPTLAAIVLAAACSESPASRSLSPAGTASLRDEGPGNPENEDNGGRVQTLRLRDDCDPTSFNAVLGAGACVGNGGTTLAAFNAELAMRGFVGAWKMNPDHFGGVPGTVIAVTNRGGETHTFTPVAVFGGGLEGRPFAAAAYYRRGLVTRILVSNVHVGPAEHLGALPTQVTATREVLFKLGVPESAIET